MSNADKIKARCPICWAEAPCRKHQPVEYAAERTKSIRDQVKPEDTPALPEIGDYEHKDP